MPNTEIVERYQSPAQSVQDFSRVWLSLRGKNLYEPGMHPHGSDLEGLPEEGICGPLLEENGASSPAVCPWEGLWNRIGIEIPEKVVKAHLTPTADPVLSLEMVEGFP